MKEDIQKGKRTALFGYPPEKPRHGNSDFINEFP